MLARAILDDDHDLLGLGGFDEGADFDEGSDVPALQDMKKKHAKIIMMNTCTDR